MSLHISCEPPVGLATVNLSDRPTFFATVRDSKASDYQVVIWHNGHVSRSWEALELQRVAKVKDTEYFRGSLGAPVFPLRFTLKYRVNGSDWKWLNDHSPHPDGVILLQTPQIPDQLEDFVEWWDPEWQIEQQCDADALGSSWILAAHERAGTEQEAGWSTRSLGTPKDTVAWFALVRHSVPWLGPRQGDGLFDPDKEALLVSFLRTDGLHVAILPLNGVPDLTSTIRGDSVGNCIISTRNDGREDGESTVILAVAKTTNDAISIVVNKARRLLGGDGHLADQSKSQPDVELERWYDAFTYCTWNGVGQQLNEEKLLSALAQLKKSGIDFSNLIIDDNWQSLDFKGNSNFDYKWTDFEANQEGFPNGLKSTINKIKQAHPYLNHIGVWHGMFGYWGGMDPKGNVVKNYKSMTAMKQTAESYLPNGPITTVQGSDIARMYDDFYAFLADSGIDSVKTDNQFMPDYLADAPDRRDTMYSYQEAWAAAVEKHFQHRGIVSMAQTPQILFYTFLAPCQKPPYLTRNSDDFFPDEPSSHIWHIFCNAHNALLTQHFNMLPDWDMFQTAGQFATIHTVARCLSGGPIYITDPPGEHDFKLIESMTAKAMDGRAIALRPSSVAYSMEPYVRPHTDRFLYLGTSHQEVSMLGLFNVIEEGVHQLVKLDSFPKIDVSRSYMIRSHFGESITGPLHVEDELPLVYVELKQQQAEVLSAAPVHDVNGIQFSIFGLIRKFTGAAAICNMTVNGDFNHGVLLNVQLKAVGILGIWLNHSDQYCAKRGITARFTIDGSAAEVSLDCSETVPNLIEFDVHSAWASLSKDVAVGTEGGLEIRIDGLDA